MSQATPPPPPAAPMSVRVPSAPALPTRTDVAPTEKVRWFACLVTDGRDGDTLPAPAVQS